MAEQAVSCWRSFKTGTNLVAVPINYTYEDDGQGAKGEMRHHIGWQTDEALFRDVEGVGLRISRQPSSGTLGILTDTEFCGTVSQKTTWRYHSPPASTTSLSFKKLRPNGHLPTGEGGDASRCTARFARAIPTMRWATLHEAYAVFANSNPRIRT